MKTFRLFASVLCFIVSQSIFAQDPLLFEGKWALYSLEIDGEQFLPPSNDEVEFVDLVFVEADNGVPDAIIGVVCDSFYAGVTFEEIGGAYTFMIGDDYVTTLGECSESENGIFQNRYFTFYETSISDPFEYSIVFLGNYPTLHVVASNGDTADYGNRILSASDFIKPSFSVYPNPTSDQLYIDTDQGTGDYTITVFDIQGKQRITTSKEKLGSNPLQIQNWASGVYFIRIENQNGIVTTKRFIKN